MRRNNTRSLAFLIACITILGALSTVIGIFWKDISNRVKTKGNDIYNEISMGSDAYKQLKADFDNLSNEYVVYNQVYTSRLNTITNELDEKLSLLEIETENRESLENQVLLLEQALENLRQQYDQDIGQLDNSAVDMAKMLLEAGVTDITIPEGVTSLRNYAFANLDYQCGISITLPSTLKTLGSYCFSNSTLFALNLDYVENIGTYAFQNFTWPFVNSTLCFPSVKNIQSYAFVGCRVDYLDFSMSTELFYIPISCFFGSTLKNILLPNSINSVGASAFKNCIYLTSIILPNNILNLSNQMFSGCTSLSSITFPNKLQSIESVVFSNCDKLIHIKIPFSVTLLNTNIFNISSLRTIYIPSNVVNITDKIINLLLPNLTIYCGITEKPSNWHENWHNGNNVVWGVSESEYDTIVAGL